MNAKRVILVLSGLLGGLLGWHPPDESDVYWHLALGRAVLRTGSRVVPEPYAIGALGEPTVVPEWLWGVLTFGVHEAGGFTGLTLLTIALGVLGGCLVAIWVDSLRVEQETSTPLGGATHWVLTALGVTMLGARLRARPELLALCLVLLFMLQARKFFRSEGALQRKTGASLFALTVLWSQVHGSAVLAPALFVLNADLQTVGRGPQRRALMLTFLLLVLGVLTCAHGVDVVQYIIDHGSGDAAAHIADMSAGSWASFLPSGSPYGAAMSALVLCWLFALVLAPFRLGDALLALLGLALYFTATRFATMMTFIGMPLAVTGVAAMKRGRALHFAGAQRNRALGIAAGLAALALVGWVAREVDRVHPLFLAGLPRGTFPLRAANALSGLPAGTNVHTAIGAGAPLGFLSDGKLRVSIDSRIPLHFDDAEYGTYRDAVHTEAALPLYFRRFEIGAAVVNRNGAECPILSRSMRLVSLDAQHATFIPGQGTALPGLEACSIDHVTWGCPDPGATKESVEKLLRQRDDAYGRWLKTVTDLECRRVSPQEAFDDMPSARTFPTIRDAVTRWRVRALWRADRKLEALAELRAELTRTDTRAIAVLTELWSSEKPVADALRVLHARGVRDMDDAVPARERGKLAVLCLADGDEQCAYVQALRAAVLGDKPALNVLKVLAQRHPREHVRKNIAAWLRVLPD